ncbi:MAG: hypothetical protein ACM3MF_04255, partial [Anaerolineae bacterium]
MKKFLFLVVIATVLLSACAPAAKPTEAPAAANPGFQMDSAKVAPQFFTDAAFKESQDLMTKQ